MSPKKNVQSSYELSAAYFVGEVAIEDTIPHITQSRP